MHGDEGGRGKREREGGEGRREGGCKGRGVQRKGVQGLIGAGVIGAGLEFFWGGNFGNF